MSFANYQPCAICGHTLYVDHIIAENGTLIVKCERCETGYRNESINLFGSLKPTTTKDGQLTWLNAFQSIIKQDGQTCGISLSLINIDFYSTTSQADEINRNSREKILQANFQSFVETDELLFSVPLLPYPDEPISNLNSSHWYASEDGIRILIEDVLGRNLIGRRITTATEGPIYIGIATSDVNRVTRLDEIAERVLELAGQPISTLERKARFEIHVLRAGQFQIHDLKEVTQAFFDSLSPQTPTQILDLFLEICGRYNCQTTQIRGQAAQISSLDHDLHLTSTAYIAMAKDAANSASELTNEIIRLRKQLASAKGTENNATHLARPDANDLSARAPSILKLLEKTGHHSEFLRDAPDPWPANRPLVSVIIPSFNYGSFVNDAINSVLAQTFDSFEVIVVEGGSSDPGSRRHVANLDRTLVRVVMQGAGHRAGANRNFGISQALGKYICCLDADDKLKPTYLEKAVYLLEQCEMDVVSAAQQCFGTESTIYHVEQRPNLDDLLERNNVLTCAVFPRVLWKRAGGFRDTDREITGYVYEDWSFWVRLAALGAKFFNMARDPLLLYRVHGSSLSRGADVVNLVRQRSFIKEINADVINEDIIEYSYRLNNTDVHPRAPVSSKFNNIASAKFKYTILLALPYLGLGGAERLISGIALHLSQTGVNLIIMTSIPIDVEIGNSVSWFEEFTSEIYNLPQFLPKNTWENFLEYLIIKKGVDLIWLAGSAFLYDNLRNIKSKCPQIAVVDLIFNTVGHTENNQRRRMHIDHVIVENTEVYSWFIRDGLPDKNLSLIESGVDIKRINPGLRSLDLRQGILEGEDDIIVAFCGRWSIEKHPMFFIELARNALGTMPIKFVMTGTGPLRRQIEEAVNSASFPKGYFTLLGEVDDVLPYMASADIIMIPSVLDGRPLAALESLACGTPVIASRVGGLPDIIQHGYTGWLCSPNDSTSFLAALSEAAVDRDRLDLMRQNARRFAENFLNISKMFKTYEELFDRLITERK